MGDGGVILGKHATSRGIGRPPKQKEAGRVCVEPGCATLLSIYNKDETCSPHTPLRISYMRAPRKKKQSV